ncbi:MAG: hypothetical protein QM820_38070 [Minicystis sp.]
MGDARWRAASPGEEVTMKKLFRVGLLALAIGGGLAIGFMTAMPEAAAFNQQFSVPIARLGIVASDRAPVFRSLAAPPGVMINSLDAESPLLTAPMLGGGYYQAEPGDIILAANDIALTGGVEQLQTILGAGGHVRLNILDTRHEVVVQVLV